MHLTNKTLSIAFLLSLAWGGYAQAQSPWDQLFDGRRTEKSFLPGGPGIGKGDLVPAVGESSAVIGRPGRNPWLGYQDPFSQTGTCSDLDRAFSRQPSLKEALPMLETCLHDVSLRYGADISAVLGPVRHGRQERQGFLLLVRGENPAMSNAAEALRTALGLRENAVLGHPAWVVLPEEARSRSGLSVLQPIVDQVEASRAKTVISSVRSVQEFVAHYGEALRKARNLGIVDVMAHPTKEWAVVVYTRGQVNHEIEGYVEINKDDQRLRIAVEPRRQVASSGDSTAPLDPRA